METRKIEEFVLHSIEASPKLQHMLSPGMPGNTHPILQSFAVMGLNEEAGEVAGLACRECYKEIGMPQCKWLEELGDVLWYVANVARYLGVSLSDIAEGNIAKLSSRKNRNKLHGEGDNR